jgi:hypothetical protein
MDKAASPAQISTALSHIVHLLMLCMHYLAIRLPAEIILPQPEQPLPTIYPLLSSYVHRPQNSSTTGGQSSSSPTGSRHEQPTQSRARPLHITKPLPILINEDPVAYSLFIEGVVLLAYNIAWVCKSQGADIGEEGNFDDICDIGKNLYALLLPPKARSQPSSRVSSNTSTPSKAPNRTTDNEEKKFATEPLMGRYSHGTATNSLNSAEGTEFVKSWKLTSPRHLTDKLKALLSNEVANKEWEIVDENAWRVNDELGVDGVVIGVTKEGSNLPAHLAMQQSFMSCRTVVDAVEVGGRVDEPKVPGTSGWTKLKPR